MEEEVTKLLQSIGADIEVLEAYNCQPLRARIVRDILRIRTPYGNWGLKKVHLPARHLEVIHELTEHIANSGLFRVPRFIKTRYGDAFVTHPTGVYYMAPWLPGRETDLRNPQHFFAAATLLSAWHTSAHGFRGIEQLPLSEMSIVDRLQTGYQRLMFLVKKARQNPSPTPFERLVLASEDELKARLELAQHRFANARLEQLEVLARQGGFVCHGRFFKKNILFDGVTYTVVNYDHAQAGSPLVEFAFYLHRYMPSYEWDLEILLEVIHAYQTSMPFNPLTIAQLSALIGAPFRPLQIIAWYQSREVAWEEEDFIDAFELALDLEEARERATLGLVNHPNSSLPVTKAVDEQSETGSSNDFIQATTSLEASNGHRNRDRKKKRTRKTREISSHRGPTILASLPNPADDSIVQPSWAADKHGGEHDKQKHEDEQI